MNNRVWYISYKRNWKKCLVSSLLIFASVSQGNDNDYTAAFSIEQAYKIKSELLDLLYDPDSTCPGCKSDGKSNGKGLVSKPPWLFLSTNNTANYQEVTVYIVLTDAQVNEVDSQLNQVLEQTQMTLGLITTVINQASQMYSGEQEADIDILIENLVQARRSEQQIIQLKSLADRLLINDLPGETNSGVPRAVADVRFSHALVQSGDEMDAMHNCFSESLQTRDPLIILPVTLDYAKSIQKHFKNYQEWISSTRSFLPKSSG